MQEVLDSGCLTGLLQTSYVPLFTLIMNPGLFVCSRWFSFFQVLFRLDVMFCSHLYLTSSYKEIAVNEILLYVMNTESKPFFVFR